MIKAGDIVTLKAEKLIYGGGALARLDGFCVFLDNAAPNDTVEAKIIKVNKNFARAEVKNIIEPSPCRKKPFCPLFNACGGCSYQYIDYDVLLKEKNNMLREALGKVEHVPEFLEPKGSPDKAYRRKIQYSISETKNSKRVLAGYYKEKTHDIVNIKFCPIQPPLADSMAQYLRENWNLGCYVENKHKGLLKNFVLRISKNLESLLVTMVLNCRREEFKKFEEKINAFASNIMGEFKQIKGFTVNFNPDKTNKILSDEFLTILGDNFITETLKSEFGGEYKYKISAGSFFQVNPNCAQELFDTVKSFMKPDSTVLDAYGGVGTIGIWLKDKARKIYLVEESASSVSDAKENFKLNDVKSYEVFLGDAKEQFKKFIKDKKKFDCAIIDPPRKGCDQEALQLLAKTANSIIYVSCNPTTLARDIKILEQLGFQAKMTQAVDMFCYSYHIESVTLIERQN